ncbi:MAG: helix-turn-helix domain-containing protein [Clostridiaceae bacterium]|nr:helix-turn-helix domain-containing protein [Clostridiaceae bacterium]
MEFNRAKLMENIMSLIQQKGLKIGDVEAEAGVSTGYLSRLSKKETDSAPSADIVWKLAKALGVSTDMLIEGDFSHATDNLLYMRNFISRLKYMTDVNEMDWKTITMADVEDALKSGKDSLFFVKERQDGQDIGKTERPRSDFYNASLAEYGTRRIHSMAAPNSIIWVTGSSYFCWIDDKTKFYMIPMGGDFATEDDQPPETIEFYDLYLERWTVNPDLPEGSTVSGKDYNWYALPLCNTLNNAQELAGDIHALYNAIARREYDLKITGEVRAVIDNFMLGSNELPFNEPV